MENGMLETMKTKNEVESTATPGPLLYKDGQIYCEKTGQTVALLKNGEEKWGPILVSAQSLLIAMQEAEKGFVDILSNHPDVWPSRGISMNLSPERRGWRKKIQGYLDAVQNAVQNVVSKASQEDDK